MSVRGEFMNVLWVGAGGFIGSSLRYLVSGWVQRLAVFGTFPWGTLAVNGLGCLALGLLGGLAEARQVLGPAHRAFLFIGVLGGFTTFSTFAYETMGLAQQSGLRALGNVALQVGLGLAAAGAGYVLGRSL
jgi:CrcB protein